MKNLLRLASIRLLIMLTGASLCLLPLTGCANTKLPAWLTGEPGEEVTAAPRTVRQAPSHDVKGWPNVASVPAKPTDFSSPAERQNRIQQMEHEKTQAEAIKQDIETESDATPLPEASTHSQILPLTVPQK